jgi:hypothetical protein
MSILLSLTCPKWLVFFNLSQKILMFILTKNLVQKDYKMDKLCSSDLLIIMHHIPFC